MARGKEPRDFDNVADAQAWVRANPQTPITCACGGRGCRTCDGGGTVPAWMVDPDVTGYPYERGR